MLKSGYLKVLVGIFAVLGVILIGVVVFWFLAISAATSIEPRTLEADYIQRERDMASRANLLQWFPDSRRIAFSHKGGVYVIDATGTNLQLIDGAGNDLELAFAPSIAPDGSRIAYVAYRQNEDSDSWEIMTAKPDGSDRRQLTRNNRMELNPIWTSDGNRIAYMYFYLKRPDNSFEEAGIYDMAMDGSDARLLAKFEDLDPNDAIGVSGSRYLPPILSPDGSRLAFLMGYHAISSIPESLYLIGVDGSDATRITERTGGPPAWSPDGRRIAYINWQTHSRSDDLVGLFTIAADGTDPQEATKLPAKELRSRNSISWSPDGAEILVGPYVVATDGSDIQHIPGPGSHASWSPDGATIAVYDSSSHPAVLSLVDRYGSIIRVLVEQSDIEFLGASR